MERLATVISYLFHPLWMPLMTFTAVYFADPFLGLHPKVFRLLLLILLVNLLAPGLSILLLRRQRVVSDLDISKRSERFVPFVLFVFYYGLSYVWLRMNMQELYMPVIVFSVFTGLLVSLLVAIVVTTKTKISMHTMAIGAFCGVAAAINQMHVLGLGFFVALLLFIAAAVAWARITLRMHTQGQVYAGFLLGFFIQYLTLIYGLYL